jgi:nucleoside-diphosphate-sugar epimerase
MPPTRTAFVAGASGAIGEVLCKLLLRDGWRVVGTTRQPERAERLRSSGVAPVLVDVFDREALIVALRAAAPDVVAHQLTDLPKEFTPENMAAARARNARIREVGTDNLVSAAVAAGAKRIVAQSIAFAYCAGPQPYSEEAPLDASSYAAVIKLEELVLGGGLEGLVLRYGRLYGPNTWTMVPPPHGPVHVEAAADAARRAMTLGQPGVYNIAEEDGTVTSAKARRELGWHPEFRLAARGG